MDPAQVTGGCVELEARAFWKNKDSPHENCPQSRDYGGVSDSWERMNE